MLPLTHPVDQLAAQGGVVPERLLQRLADLLLAEAAELQGIVLAAGADVVGEQVVVGDLVAFLGVVPEPAGVLDQQAVLVDEGVVDGDDALVAVAGGGVLLEQVQARWLRASTSQSASVRKRLRQDWSVVWANSPWMPEDGLALGDDQAGEVLGEVAALALVGEEVAELSQGVLDQLGELDDPWHDQMLRSPTAPERIEGKTGRLYLF